MNAIYAGKNRILHFPDISRFVNCGQHIPRLYLNARDLRTTPDIIYSSYEDLMTEKILSELHKDQHFIDVGANIGWHSVITGLKIKHELGGKGKVLAFEPDTTTYDYLRTNIETNLLFDTVITRPFAVSNTDGIVEYWLDHEFPIGSHLINAGSHPERNQGTVQPVKSVKLDNQVDTDSVDSIGVIKIDTEGGEYPVFKGALKLLKRYPEVKLFIELHRKLNPTGVDLLLSDLKQLNYTVNVYGLEGKQEHLNEFIIAHK